MLTTRGNGGRDLLGIGGGQDENDMLRRLFNSLKKSVEGRLRQHMDLVDDIDFAPGRRGRESDFIS